MPSKKDRLLHDSEVEQYVHADKTRLNNPEIGLVKPDKEQSGNKKEYKFDPHLDPELQWAGKAERLSFEVPTVSLHVHERIDPKTIIESVKKEVEDEQPSLFATEKKPLRQAVEFYKHENRWSNRLVAGDSLLVMNSLLEKEGMGSKVQTIYFDPPYGIKYGSNFQPFVNKRDVKDGKDEDLTTEPEMIKAFRDTWELGIHSYLSYLRDRLVLSRELLVDSGSIFVQISDENMHRVRLIMDEVFGGENFVSLITFKKTTGLISNFITNVSDYILWYAKDINKLKYNQLYFEKELGGAGATHYNKIMQADGVTRPATKEELSDTTSIETLKVYEPSPMVSQGNPYYEYEYQNRKFGGTYKSPTNGLDKLNKANRLEIMGTLLRYRRFFNDYPVYPIFNIWDDILGIQSRNDPKIYAVQTSTSAVQRCILMTSDPGDLVFDPTCLRAGSKVWVANGELSTPLNFGDVEQRLEQFSPNSGRAFLDVLVHFSGLCSPLNFNDVVQLSDLCSLQEAGSAPLDLNDVAQYSEQFPPHAGGSFFGVAESLEVGEGLITSSRDTATSSLSLSIPRKSNNSYKLPPRAGGIIRNSQTSTEGAGGQNQLPLGGITRISQTNAESIGGQQLGQYLPIEQLIPGNLVLSHDGKLHKVIRTIEREYSGIMVGLSHQKSDKPIWITSDHKVLTRKRNLDLGGHSSWRHVPKHHFQYAKENRKKETKQERKLRKLFSLRLPDFKVRRQHSLGPYILDFYLREYGLVLEVDGGQHYTEEGLEYDKKRDSYLQSLGLEVLRFSNQMVEENPELVLKEIQQFLNQLELVEEDTSLIWRTAETLRIGDTIFFGESQEPVRITSLEYDETSEIVYDIEVEGAHSFLTESCMVHNCGSGTTAYVAEQWGRRWITCDTSRVAISLAKQRLMTASFDYYELKDDKKGVTGNFKYKTVPHITLKSIANNGEIDVIHEKWEKSLNPLREKINTLTKSKFEEWEIPREPDSKWTAETKKALSDYWEKKKLRQKDIDDSISRHADQETLVDQPIPDKKRTRVTGPFTVEAVPSPTVKALGEVNDEKPSMDSVDTSIVRTGATLKQSEWRSELARVGVRAKKGNKIEFAYLEVLAGTKYLHAVGETKEKNPKRVVVSFGPEFAPYDKALVELAIREAEKLRPKAEIILFCAFQFEEEAAKDIEETNWEGVTLLKAQMNTDLFVDDLKKKRSQNDSFWLIGQPDVEFFSFEFLVFSEERIAPYEIIKKLSGLNSLAEISKLSEEDLRLYILLSQGRDLWNYLADKEGWNFHSGKHSRGTSKEFEKGISKIFRYSDWVFSGIRDFTSDLKEFGVSGWEDIRGVVDKLRRDKQTSTWTEKFFKSNSIKLETKNLKLKTLSQISVLGFDYYDPKTNEVKSGGKGEIAMWMLDSDYDGRSIFPKQVFFPLAGDKDGWAKLGRDLKADLDEELLEAFRTTLSLPFTPGKQIAVKIVDNRGIESIRVFKA